MWWMASALAGPALEAGALEQDPPTLHALGLRLPYAGDDDGDAVVTVRYRHGDEPWRDGLPLIRVFPEDVVGWTARREFAGSVFDLPAGEPIEVEVMATDPDGGSATFTLDAATRPVPGDPASPVPVAVSDAAGLRDALADAGPGTVITIADGVYAGPFQLDASGTDDDPIVLRGASQEGVVLTGSGCPDCNALEVYGSFVHVEELTLADANRALRFQGQGAVGNVVRRVTARDVQLGFGAKEDQRDFLLCDNTLLGPLAWPHVYTDDGGADANVDGILVMGSGHVVCHNHLEGWGDALKLGQDGARAVDFYGNDVDSAYDNGLELDGGEGNVRAWRNRFTNTYAALSFQPVYGGPAYVWRNLVVNVAHEQLKLHSLGYDRETSGIHVLHNTFVSAERALRLYDSTTSHHFRVQGNLFVGPDVAEEVLVEWTGGIDDGSFDNDGWWPDGRFDFRDAGDWPSFAAMVAAGVFEGQGVLLDRPPLASGRNAPVVWQERVAPTEPTLHADSAAVDRALGLPNVADDFQGSAPDLGAHGLGCPVPTYGPRPAGAPEDPVRCAPDGTTDTGELPTTPTDPGTDPTRDPAEGGCGCGTGDPRGGAFGLLALLLARRQRVPAATTASPNRS